MCAHVCAFEFYVCNFERETDDETQIVSAKKWGR